MISWRQYDKLPGYRAAKREAILGFEHRQHKGRNNRAENPTQPKCGWFGC